MTGRAYFKKLMEMFRDLYILKLGAEQLEGDTWVYRQMAIGEGWMVNLKANATGSGLARKRLLIDTV
jgi:hypothetical protein